MPYISHTELNNRIAQASKLVKLGGIYIHYKYPERRYKVLNFAIQEATEKVCVIYQDIQETDAPAFVRDLDSWLEQVEWNGSLVPRFKPAI